MDIRQAAYEILSKTADGADLDSVISQYASQFTDMNDRMYLNEIVRSALEKSKYAGRDYSSPSDIAANAKRKANNISGGSNTGLSSMPHVKEYGGSGPSAASKQAKKMKQISAKNTTRKIHPETGKVVDILHSSGKKKGKSIFSTDEERDAHIASLDKSAIDELRDILAKARSRIGGIAPMKPAQLPSEAEGIDFNTISSVKDLTDHDHSVGAMPEDHPDRQKVVDYITHLHRNGKAGEALRLYETHIKGGSGTYTAGGVDEKKASEDEMAKIAEMMNVIQGKDDHNNKPDGASEKMNRIGGREDAIN